MYVYYQIANVHAVAIKNTIKLIVDIPLKAKNRYLELYNVKQLPYYDKRLQNFVKLSIDSVI